jgi:hypothetical protein
MEMDANVTIIMCHTNHNILVDKETIIMNKNNNNPV